MNNKCLICTESISESTQFHPQCSKVLFGSKEAPILEYSLEDLTSLAKKLVLKNTTVPGVQAKLSLHLKKNTDSVDKLTLVGLWGNYILKPPSNKWKELPENEHCTMLLASASGLEVVPNGLIPLSSGELSYITKRIDRTENGKIAMEDMCQLTRRLTEDKYKGSHEQIAKKVDEFSENPLFDLTRLFELVLFCYLTGNSDMHLKNFSLIKDENVGWKLSASYDLLNTRLVISEKQDPEELCLTLDGKKRNFTLHSFKNFGSNIGLNKKQIENLLEKFKSFEEKYSKIIKKSFLSKEQKEAYHDLINSRFEIFKV